MTEPIRKLGRYELIRQLATGGMGEIYLARTRGAGGFEKHLIIKKILPHLAEEEEFVTKFLDEGRIVVQLTHGNIVPVFDMGEEDGQYFIAMEYVPGLDLRAIFKRLQARGEELPVELALHITCEVCKGLGYAHRKTDPDGNPLGIVHRDVSPSNVLISREGEVKIIDFGIARAADKLSQTGTGRIQGKCCYMSPEQARGQALDARSDIFSTGVLLYEMLTLERPFDGRSDLESLELVRQCDFDPPGVLRPSIPAEIDEVVQRAMQPEPGDRYPTIDDMCVDLQQQMYGLGYTVTSQRLAQRLTDVFEDDDLDDPEEQQRRPPADLDEALELELAKLEDTDPPQLGSSNSDLELAATATAGPDSPGTRTLPSTPAIGPRRDSGDDDGDESVPDSGAHDDKSTTGEPSDDNADAEIDDEQRSDEEATPDDATLASREVASPITRRHVIAVGAALILTTAIVTAYTLRPAPDATLELATDPPGAQVHIDGDQFAGRTTPTSLTLAPDDYHVELTLDDYEPMDFRVDLPPGEVLVLDESDLVLTPDEVPTRTFTVDTEPDDAELLADGQSLGAPPAEIELRPDDVVNLSARAPHCSTVYYALSYGHQQQEIDLALQCEEEPDGADPSEDEPETERELRADRAPRDIPTRAREQSVRIDSDPRGAEITIDDESIGETPLYAELRRGRQTTIEARHDGYETYRVTTTVEELGGDEVELQLEERARGCINFRAVYPANNKIAINDQWLDGRHMSLEAHPLPAGENTVTVHHPQSDKKESFDVEIEPGSDCKVLTVWENDG